MAWSFAAVAVVVVVVDEAAAATAKDAGVAVFDGVADDARRSEANRRTLHVWSHFSCCCCCCCG